MEIDERRVEGELPGRQGRLLFARLALARNRFLSRDELEDAVWPDDRPAAVDTALRSLVSKSRLVLGDLLEGRSELRLALGPDAWVDVHAAGRAIHLAESAVARADWAEAWPEAHIALNISRRPLLAGFDAPWLEPWRHELNEIRLRALECWAATGLGLGGGELVDAETAARTLTTEAPYRESGHLMLMQILHARGNTAEALRSYDELRTRLREDLGLNPSEEIRSYHASLLAR